MLIDIQMKIRSEKSSNLKIQDKISAILINHTTKHSKFFRSKINFIKHARISFQTRSSNRLLCSPLSCRERKSCTQRKMWKHTKIMFKVWKFLKTSLCFAYKFFMTFSFNFHEKPSSARIVRWKILGNFWDAIGYRNRNFFTAELLLSFYLSWSRWCVNVALYSS